MTRQRNQPAGDAIPDERRRVLSLLSFNIQTGVELQYYRHYVTKSWKHLLPFRERISNLNNIARLIKGYDVVGLQEVDSGSLRSGFLDQTEYLAKSSGFPHWYRQVNRNMGKVAQHSNGLLSRLQPYNVEEHKLPGLPGRGAMLAEYHTNHAPLMVCIMHLALGKRARHRQLAYIAELVGAYPQLVVMGDFNCTTWSPELLELVNQTRLCLPADELKTFPSWRPTRRYDHILISDTLQLRKASVLEHTHSDHLPISVEIELPKDTYLRCNSEKPLITGHEVPRPEVSPV